MTSDRISPLDAPDAAAIEAVASQLSAARTVLLCAHENPDGDAIGSLVALKLALDVCGKSVVGALPNPVSERYRFLPGCGEITCDPPKHGFDLAVALDCDGITRLAVLQDAFRAAAATISIDHHSSGDPFAQTSYVRREAAATGVLVYHLLKRLGAELSPEISTCLYTSISTDTGSFRFQNTNAEALRIAGEMAAIGADPYAIAQATGERRPVHSLRLLGLALASLRCGLDGRLVWGLLTRQDFAAAGAEDSETEGIIDSFKMAERADLYLLLREESEAKWRGSLRSQGADVAAIARRFGGGGHRVAAGFSLEGSRAEVQARVLEAIEEGLGAGN